MKFFTPGIRLSILLLLLCTLLGGLLAHEWRTVLQSPTVTAANNSTAVTSNTPPATVTYAPPTIAAFGEILERPLFTPGREPPEPEPVAAPVVKITPLRLQLEGVGISIDARVAVVRDLSSNELIRIAEGDQHDGWLLEQVHPTGATFSLGSETRELTLVPDETQPNRR